LYHIANHRAADSVISFLEGDGNKIKENVENRKTCKKTKKIVNAKNIGHYCTDALTDNCIKGIKDAIFYQTEKTYPKISRGVVLILKMKKLVKF
jgi:hypothetical protein